MTDAWTIDELRTLLSSISHDLRTPLSVITGRASVLRATGPTSQQRDLDTIITEAQRTSRTLENLLAITDPAPRARREWVPVEELVGAVLARLERALEGHPVHVDVPDDLLAHVDPVLGELLLANLVDAAATHAAETTPLGLRARRTDAAVILEVVDRATGAPSPRDRIPARATELAHAASRRIVTLHGGALERAPRDGGGTVVRIEIPDGEPLPDLGVG